MNYPVYKTPGGMGREPTIMQQSFPGPGDLDDEMQFYRIDDEISVCLDSEEQVRAYGAYLLAMFLSDTIAVEHRIVIPAVSAATTAIGGMPATAAQDMFAIVADEGFHAEQSLSYINRLAERFSFSIDTRAPPFMQSLQMQRSRLSDPSETALWDVINGVVTETRISVELSTFAKNDTLCPTVREICRQHHQDEAYHASQFRALGQWHWEQSHPSDRELIAGLYAESILRRNAIDAQRRSMALHLAMGLSLEECNKHIRRVYSDDFRIEEAMHTAKPTLRFLDKLGISQHAGFKRTFQENRFLSKFQ